jgi:hypothetical protein
MFSKADIKQIKDRGSVIEAVNKQIRNFKQGFPFLRLDGAATPDDGILILGNQESEKLIAEYDAKSKEKEIVKFVPAWCCQPDVQVAVQLSGYLRIS